MVHTSGMVRTSMASIEAFIYLDSCNVGHGTKLNGVVFAFLLAITQFACGSIVSQPDAQVTDTGTGIDAATCTNSCDDNNVCTTDTCSAAGCTNVAITCEDSNACTTNSCDSVAGCQFSALTCDDSNLCTTDSCDMSTGCVFAALDPNGTTTLSYTGALQTFTVPACVSSVRISVEGAQGGASAAQPVAWVPSSSATCSSAQARC